jgi:hypothetical protein
MPPGRTVFLTDAGGTTSKGTVTQASPSSLTVRSNGTSREFHEADIRTVKVREPLWEGLIIGAAAGGFLFYIGNDSACVLSAYDSCGGSYGAAVLGAAIGGGIGAGIDALVWRHRTLFRSPGGSTAGVSIAPVIGAGRRGLSLTARF